MGYSGILLHIAGKPRKTRIKMVVEFEFSHGTDYRMATKVIDFHGCSICYWLVVWNMAFIFP
jgi:hypothetical protein